MTHESWERIPDTIRVRIPSWESYSIKAWEGWDPEGGSRYSASQAITSPDKRSGDFFWFIFCFFWSRESVELLRQNAWQKQVAHGVWGETKVHYGDLLRSGTSLFFCWFTMEWRSIFFDIWRNVYNYSLGDTRRQRLASCVRGECGLEALYGNSLEVRSACLGHIRKLTRDIR